MLNGIIYGAAFVVGCGAALVAWDFIAGFIAGARSEWRGQTIADALVSRATPRAGLGLVMVSVGSVVSLIALLAKAVFT